MPLLLNNSRTVRWLIRLIKVIAWLMLTVILLASLVVVFLPTAVSTDRGHDFIREKISTALDRPVEIQRLQWSWAGGIMISHLTIPDLPEFSKNSLAALENVKLSINIKKLLHRQVDLEFLVSGLTVNVIKTGSGALNVNTLLKKNVEPEKPPAPLNKEKPEKKSGKTAKKPFTLPSLLKDMSADIRLTGINLCYDDQAKAKNYRIKNFEIHVSAPSLKSEPIRLELNTDILVNENAIPGSTITASINNLFSETGALNINGLTAELDAKLPGIMANLEADMAASRLNSHIEIDLASVMDAAVPLVPDFPTPTAIKGKVVLTAAADTNPAHPLAFDASLSGSGVAVEGKLIKGKAVGPGNIHFHLNGLADLNNELLDLHSAEILILENSVIAFKGRVEQLKQANRTIHLTVAPLYLDVNEIVSYATPFIPSSLHIDSPKGNNAFISLNELQMNGQLPKGKADIRMDGLKIHVPNLILTDKTNGQPMMRISGSRINLENLTAQLKDLFPGSASLTLSLAMDKLIKGKEKNLVAISGMRMDRLHADARNIAKTDGPRVPVSGDFSLDNQVNIDRIELVNEVQVNDLSQSMKIKAAIDANRKITGTLDHLDVDTPKIHVSKKGTDPIDTGMDIHLALDKIIVTDFNPLNLDIYDFMGRITADDALSIALTASAADTANTSFKADVTMDSDLNALAKKLPPGFMAGLSGAGDLSISLNTEGRRPRAEETEALKKYELANNLSFIHRLEIDARLDNGALKIFRPDNQAIKIDSFTGQPLLKYELDGDTGKGKFNSEIYAGAVTGLPGIHPDAPISGQLSISADHEYAASIDLSQSLSIAPIGIEETVHAALDGTDRIITGRPMPGLSPWLSKAGADVSARIKIPDCRMLEKLEHPALSKLELDGLLDAGLEFFLIPGKSVGGKITLAAADMNISMPETLSLENLDANIDFSKSYDIGYPQKTGVISEAAGISNSVLESGGPSFLVARDSEIYRHIRQRYERMNPKPALSFGKADIMAAPFPLMIGDSLVMLSLDNGLPSLDYFQFNLLGGTINGSVFFSSEQKNVNVNTALTFSGINTAQIFPHSFSPKNDDSEADISGALYADFPLSNQLQPLLENAAVILEFTRIGTRALERLLYALDPYENNEAIVNQRRILRNGSPKNIRVEIKNGFLSLTGKVTIKGIDIALPSIRRLNIAQIPGLEKFEKKLYGLTPVIRILQTISAKQIIINKETDSVHFE